MSLEQQTAHLPFTYKLRLVDKRHDSIFLELEWTRDKAAVCEIADQFNGHKTFDLRAGVVEIGGRRGYSRVVIFKGDHILGESTPRLFDDCLPVAEEVNYFRGRHCGAAIETAVASDNALRMDEKNNENLA